MKIMIIGGDGYLGWPLSMHLSSRNHEILIVDNFARRNYDSELALTPMVPIKSLRQRISRWAELSNKRIRSIECDVCDYDRFISAFNGFTPDAIIHLGEQRSAPYSMIDRKHAVYTQFNNIIGTLNLLFCIRNFAPECHLIKLGTMGVYGTPNIDIEEGFITINHNGRKDLLPFPKQAGSFYHLSKVHDSNNIFFCCKSWNLKATDLNQGVVYGAQTNETKLHEDLQTRFDYDAIFGTVINRFCVQAVVGHPLTIYGKGNQIRSYIYIVDALKCIEWMVENPVAPGEYRVVNQFTDIMSIKNLASLVGQCALERGWNVDINCIENPRVEKDEHYYCPKNSKIMELDFIPLRLNRAIIQSIFRFIEKYTSRIDREKILPNVKWSNN